MSNLQLKAYELHVQKGSRPDGETSSVQTASINAADVDLSFGTLTVQPRKEDLRKASQSPPANIQGKLEDFPVSPGLHRLHNNPLDAQYHLISQSSSQVCLSATCFVSDQHEMRLMCLHLTVRVFVCREALVRWMMTKKRIMSKVPTLRIICSYCFSCHCVTR